MTHLKRLNIISSTQVREYNTEIYICSFCTYFMPFLLDTLVFDGISQSMAEMKLLLVSDDGRPPYWNSTSGFDFDICTTVVVVFYSLICGIQALSERPTGFLQCFDTVGLVIWPVKIVPDMTYNVFGGTLNLAQSINPRVQRLSSVARSHISVLSGRISVKLGTCIQHISGQCWKGFQGQRSKVKVIASPDALFRPRQINRRFAVQDHLLLNVFWAVICINVIVVGRVSVVRYLFNHLSTSTYSADDLDAVKRQFDVWFLSVLWLCCWICKTAVRPVSSLADSFVEYAKPLCKSVSWLAASFVVCNSVSCDGVFALWT